MGVHILAATKLGFFSSAAAPGATNPVAAVLFCSYALKLLSSTKVVRTVLADVALASRLFFFQFGQIASDGGDVASGGRWRRTFRLVRRRITQARRLTDTPSEDDDDRSFRFAVAMLSL